MACRLRGVAISKQGRQEATGRFAYYIDAIGPNGRGNGNMKLVDEALLDPFKWRRPQMVFANSMSDLFHKNLSIEDIRKVCKVMAATDWHIYQVLTTRADILAAALNGPLREYANCRHIWWGVSVENQRHGLPRIDLLKTTPAAVKFLSIEPLLEDLGTVDFSGIDWAIVGGESGSRYRPMDIEWACSLRDQCVAQKVPYFFKQFGTRNKKAAGRILDGRTWDEMPAINRQEVPSREEIERRKAALTREFAVNHVERMALTVL